MDRLTARQFGGRESMQPGAQFTYRLHVDNHSSYSLNGTLAVFEFPNNVTLVSSPDGGAVQFANTVVVTPASLSMVPIATMAASSNNSQLSVSESFCSSDSRQALVPDGSKSGGRNYVIDLLGESSLESIELWYYKEPRGHNPRVSLYGVRLPKGDGPNIAQEH